MHIWKSEKSDKIGQSTDMYCRICVSRRYLGIPPLTPFLFCGVFSVRYHGADSTDMYGDMPKLESPRKDTTNTLLVLCCTFSRLFYLHNCCHNFDKIGQSTDMYCRICVSRRYLGIPPLTPFLFCGVFSVRYHGADSTDMYGDMPKLESPRKDTTDTLLLLCCTFSRLFYLHNCCHNFDKIGQSADMYCRICVSRRYLGIPPLTPYFFCCVLSVRYHGADSTDMYGDMRK
jgi:hypothetical protein